MNVQPTQNKQKDTKERILPSKAVTLTVNERTDTLETISLSKNYSIKNTPHQNQSDLEIVVNNMGFLESYKSEALFLTAEGKRALGIEDYHQKRRDIG